MNKGHYAASLLYLQISAYSTQKIQAKLLMENINVSLSIRNAIQRDDDDKGS